MAKQTEGQPQLALWLVGWLVRWLVGCLEFSYLNDGADGYTLTEKLIFAL